MTAPPTGRRVGGVHKVLRLADGFQPLPPPRKPKGLGKVGSAWWSNLWQGGERFLNASTDALVIELICRAQDVLAEIETTLAREGRYYVTKQGQRLPHPGVADSRAVSAQIVSWLSLCGFTPTDRARLGDGAQGVSELDAWRRSVGKIK